MPNALERGLARLLPRLPDRWALKMAGGEPLVLGGRTLDPHAQLIASQAARQPGLEELLPEQARRVASDGRKLVDGPPRPMESVEDLAVPGPGGDLPLRLYRPHGLLGPRPLLLYFHQGGCVIGDLDWSDTFCTILAETARCLVASVGYRLAPEHRFPAAVEDAVAAYRWAFSHGDEVGADRRIAVGGDSAGGLLSAAITHEMRRTQGPQPVFQLLVYPWLVALADTPSYATYGDSYPLSRKLMEWFVSHYLNDPEERDDPRASPLLEDDFRGLPPALVATAGFDPLCDEGALYAEKLASAGVPVVHRCYESLPHSFTMMSGAVPAARAALEEIARDLERALAAGEA